MSWVFVALSAYFFLAFANLLDKFLVDQIIKSSRAYAFIVCLMGLAAFIIAPWFLSWPGWPWFLFFLLVGALFAISLLFLYEALRRGEASRTIMIVGGSTPIFSIIFSWLFWGEFLSRQQLMGFLFLIIGIFLIAFLPIYHGFWQKIAIKLGFRQDKRRGGLLIAVISGLFYSFYFISSKQAYNYHEFFNVFLWTRLGALFLVLFFLFDERSRKNILAIFRPSGRAKRSGLVIFNQTLGSTGFILQNYAISLGPVAIINALQGFQYALIIVLSGLGVLFFPRLAKEDFRKSIIWQKIAAVIIITIGLFLVAT